MGTVKELKAVLERNDISGTDYETIEKAINELEATLEREARLREALESMAEPLRNATRMLCKVWPEEYSRIVEDALADAAPEGG
jgi:hypothetical protein